MRLLGGGVLALFVNHQPSSYIAYTRKKICTTSLHGINDWRDQAIESNNKYTLDSSYKSQQQQPNTNDNPTTATPSKVPILPFPFSDVLLLGQRTQLNLYEQRFHELFEDAMDNHCGIIGQGLLAGNGMITTLPLCEVESYTRLGAEDNWIDTGNGMGNGSIFVTIRAVSRAKIVESDLLQEGPYMIARVVELVDEELSIEDSLIGESSALKVASLVASNIENLMLSLASMEHKLKAVEEKRYLERKETNDDDESREVNAVKDGEEGVMSRRIINAQLESLFMQESNEGVDVTSSGQEEDDAIEDNEDDDNTLPDESDEVIDRVAQFAAAFESAKEADTFGYIMPSTLAVPDNLLSKAGPSKQTTIRNSKDLAGISWAAYCTGEKNNLQRDVIKIQALDMTNILKRLQLAASMLLEEKKRLKAKLALAGITDPGNTESRD